MRIPRDLSGNDLIKLLKKYDYQPSRQMGSHIRLTTHLNGEHHITIPNHSPIKIGALSAILSEVATYIDKTKEEIIHEFFGCRLLIFISLIFIIYN